MIIPPPDNATDVEYIQMSAKKRDRRPLPFGEEMTVSLNLNMNLSPDYCSSSASLKNSPYVIDKLPLPA